MDQFPNSTERDKTQLTTGFTQYTKSLHGFGICEWGTKIPLTIIRIASKNGSKLAATVGVEEADANANENMIWLQRLRPLKKNPGGIRMATYKQLNVNIIKKMYPDTSVDRA